jgi:integrase
VRRDEHRCDLAVEIVQRDVRDLDDGGRLLWIPDSKTESGKRTLEVPELLQPLLLALAKDRIGAAPLFVGRRGARPTRWWLGYHCKALCARAGVPAITPHGLRSTHGSIARRGGATGEIVATQLGHASSAITNRVYIRPEASQAAETTAVLHVMAGGKR